MYGAWYGESRKRMRYVKSKVWVLPTQFGWVLLFVIVFLHPLALSRRFVLHASSGASTWALAVGQL